MRKALKRFIYFSIFIFLFGCASDYALFQEGKKHFYAQNYDKAKEKFSEVKEKYPDSIAVELADEYLKKIERLLSEKDKKEEEKDKILIGEEKERKTEQTAEKLLSNVYYDTDIREILRNLSAETGINIIVDDTVQGVITVKYENLHFESVLKLILLQFLLVNLKIQELNQV